MKSHRSFLRLVVLFLAATAIPSCGVTVENRGVGSGETELEACFAASDTRLPSYWETRIAASLRDESIADTFKRLNEEFHIPVSFIEGRAGDRHSEVVAVNESVRNVLRRIVESAPGYQCKRSKDHVVVLGNRNEFSAVVRGVQIVSKYRAIASRDYLEKAASDVRALSDLGFLPGAPIDSPLINEKVTLAPDATVLEHLVQLLGDNPRAYFSIRWATTGSRYFTLGEVP